MEKKILITGGPVYAYLDDVKIITNKFKGGLMSKLAEGLSFKYPASVTYLCAKDVKCEGNPQMQVVYHDGFDDYMAKVLELAPRMDAVILGAAVANLIPYKRIVGKFASHNLKPGDLVPLIFQIAPRVIDKVKAVAPKAHLFGFKLLSGVDHAELIRAAYGVLLESKATTVFANDASNLDTIYAVTKERSEHKMDRDALGAWIWEMTNDEYYKTNIIPRVETEVRAAVAELEELVKGHQSWWTCCPEGYIFGTVAVRCGIGFVTTLRGKKELDGWTWVESVDHEKRVVNACERATLNAPLLDTIFKGNPKVHKIIHTHSITGENNRLPYAPPGTVRDSRRAAAPMASFEIAEHGSFMLYDAEGRIIEGSL